MSLIRVPGAAQLLDQVVMARPVQDERRDVERLAPEALGDVADVVRDGPVEVDHGAGARPDCDRAHVHIGQVPQRPLWRGGEHRHRADTASRDDTPTLDRVEREVDALAAGADPAVRRQRLARPGADHDSPVDRQLVQGRAHPVRRGILRRLLVGAAEPARAGERRPLGRA